MTNLAVTLLTQKFQKNGIVPAFSACQALSSESSDILFVETNHCSGDMLWRLTTAVGICCGD